MSTSAKSRAQPFELDNLVPALVRALFRTIWWLLRHPASLGGLLGAGALYEFHGWPAVVAGAVVVVLASVLLKLLAPAVFGRWILVPWTRARARRRYRRRWPAVVRMCGLTVGFDGVPVLPKLQRVGIGTATHNLVIRLVVGQHPGVWQSACPQLAAAFGARLARVYVVRPGFIRLELLGDDGLGAVVPAMPVPQVVDLESVAIGRREDGQLWRLPLLGWHVFLGGVTNSGKSSVIWSLLSGLAPAVRDGLVSVWAVDPKGGMEFGFGAPMFARFGRGSTEAIVGVLEDAVRVMDERCARLAGVARKHVPTLEEPLVLVLIDEVSTLTAYEPDVKLRNRAIAAISALLARGRAAAVVVVAAAQDPRKEVIGFRSLFPVRVALRLDTATQVDMVLGEGMHGLGATAEDIPAETPGVGFVVVEGQREPVRVRAGYIDDESVHRLVATYPAPAVTAEGEAA